MAQMSLKRRIIVILYIISFTISLFIFSFAMERVSIDIECTSYSSFDVNGSDIYFAQNIKGTGIILKTNPKGNVSKIFLSKSLKSERVLGISVNNGNVYAVLSKFIEKADADNKDAFDSSEAYQIICLDNKLGLLTLTPKFTIDDDSVLCGFTTEEKGIYMTMLAKDGMNVKVLCINPADLKTMDELSDANISIEAIRSKNASNGRFFSDALYKQGQLYVRTDADEATGVFAIDEYIKEVVSNLKLTIGQLFSLYSVYFIWYVTALLAWFIVLYLIVRAVLNRNRSFYYILIAEGVLFIIAAVGVYAVVSNYQDARTIEHSRFAVTSLIGIAEGAGLNENIDYSDAAIYNTERYQEIKNTLCEFVKRDGNSAIFYDVFVYRLDDNVVCASGSGRNRQLLTDIFGQELTSLSESIYKGNPYTAEDITVDGQNYRVVAVEVDQATPKYALVGIINVNSLNASVFVNNSSYFILFLIVFAIGSALVVLVWMLHMRDLERLEIALSNTAIGNSLPPRPVTIGRDVKDMFDSLSEIYKRIDQIEYTKLRILEAYFRFAPKNVEKALAHNSILEVNNGEKINTYGTYCKIHLSVTGEKRLAKLEKIIGIIGDYQKEHKCIIVGKASDMSSCSILFMDNETNTVDFLTELYSYVTKGDDAVSLSSSLVFGHGKFGVIGSDVEATTYLDLEEKELARMITAFAYNLGLGILITENIKEREKISVPMRFIGHVKDEASGKATKLYEILDAYPTNTRLKKISVLERFEDALNSYYEKDFYIARNKFSEILKFTPDDELVRWYVFESDKYLNEYVDDESFKYIHI
ncbi:MAG: hypothetical protein J6N21_15105 [Butyrivibrio sp.]|nr:hypothetical protein [Butyrivibrio sp.]